MIIELSHSSTSVARQCWMKYYWAYIQQLRKKVATTAQSLGVTLHGCFEMRAKGAAEADIQAFIEKTFTLLGATPEEEEKALISKLTIKGMWKNYPYDDSKDFSKIEAEQKFRTKLANLCGVYWRGRVDSILTERPTNQRWLREYKVTSIEKESFRKKVSTSFQPSGYKYGIEKTSSGGVVQGVVYDYIGRPRLRKRVSETSQEFAERIYEDYCNPERREHYYDRFYVYRSLRQVELFEQDIVELAREIRYRTRTGRFYRNPDSCYDYNSECDYMPICWEAKPDEGLIKSLYTKGVDRWQM